MAFLETIVAFCPYHVTIDPCAAGPTDVYYEAALARYKKVPYNKLHSYIAEGLVAWYGRFKPDSAGAEAVEDARAEDDGDGDDTCRPDVGDKVPDSDSSPSFSLTRKGLNTENA